MRELVIVIQDLYLPAAPAAGAALRSDTQPLAGLGFVARFGARAVLAHGWRAWLAGWLGRSELAGVAPARIAAAAHPGLTATPGTLWLAAPVHLSAGLSRVHLDPRGLLYLSAAELAQLAQDFARAFAGSGFALTPASPRELLLLTPGIEAVATAEPARFAGAEVNEALPRGPAAAGLRRTWTEIEMWLHAQPLNQARRLPVTALWPWGALGETAVPAPAAVPAAPAAFAADAYVRGLWHICGRDCRAVPEALGAVLDSGASAPCSWWRRGLCCRVLRKASPPRSRSWMRATWPRPCRHCARAASIGCASSPMIAASPCARAARLKCGAACLRAWKRSREPAHRAPRAG